jgi:PAS domain S-box-containing protein
VFERFHQIEDSTGQRAGGTGLGLAIVKEFTELHQGQVDVNEAPGGGALFTVRLPRRAAPGSVVAAKGCTAALDPWMDDTLCIDEPAERAAAATPGPAPLQPAGPGASADALRQAGAAQAWQAPLVLVVEDNTDLNNYIADALRPHYRVACAYDGQDGLALALALRPDLILCDLMMPRLDGAGLVARLRREGALADVPIVVLTARADEGLRVRLLQQGVQDYLDKPFAVDELLARVAGLIRSRQRSRSELERYEQIVATSGDMLCLVDQQRRFVVTNPAYAALFGRTPHDLQLRPVAEAIGAGNYARILPHLDRAFAGAVERFTITPDLPDGQRRVLDVEYRPFVQQGEVRGVVASLRDVTTLADSRAALQRRSEELAERNAELERFNRASIGRELDMIQLKQRVNTMSTQLGQAKPFDLAFIDGADLPGALRTPS